MQSACVMLMGSIVYSVMVPPVVKLVYRMGNLSSCHMNLYCGIMGSDNLGIPVRVMYFCMTASRPCDSPSAKVKNGSVASLYSPFNREYCAIKSSHISDICFI